MQMLERKNKHEKLCGRLNSHSHCHIPSESTVGSPCLQECSYARQVCSYAQQACSCGLQVYNSFQPWNKSSAPVCSFARCPSLTECNFFVQAHSIQVVESAL